MLWPGLERRACSSFNYFHIRYYDWRISINDPLEIPQLVVGGVRPGRVWTIDKSTELSLPCKFTLIRAENYQQTKSHFYFMFKLCALTRRRTTTDKPHTFSSLQRRARRWTVGHLLEPSTVLLISTYTALCSTLFIGFYTPGDTVLYHRYNTLYRTDNKYHK